MIIPHKAKSIGKALAWRSPSAVSSDNSSGFYVKKKAVPKKMAPGASAGAVGFRHLMGGDSHRGRQIAFCRLIAAANIENASVGDVGNTKTAPAWGPARPPNLLGGGLLPKRWALAFWGGRKIYVCRQREECGRSMMISAYGAPFYLSDREPIPPP
jgi:hypothetical protein